MLVMKTQHQRWWANEIKIEIPPTVERSLSRTGVWLGRIGAVAMGLALPSLLIAALFGLQLSREPDLPGGLEGLEGFLAFMVGAPVGFIGLAVGLASLPSALHRRFVLVVGTLEIVLVALALADLMG